MPKNLLSVGIVALSFAAAASYAQTLVTATGGTGSPIVGGFANWSPDPAGMTEFKAQNHLNVTQNALTRGLGKYKNTTVPGGTIPFFESYFLTGSRNSIYTYTMVGQSPVAGGTTTIPTVLITLPLELVDSTNGTTYYFFDPRAANDLGLSDLQLIQQSPAYNSNTYPGGGAGGVLPADTGQLVDTAQRASFHGVADPSWHTVWGTPSVNESYGGLLDYAAGDWVCIGGEFPPCTSFPVVNINSISNIFGQVLNLLGTGVVPNTTVPMFITDFVTAFDPSSGGCCVLGYRTAQTGVGGSGILVWGWGTYLTHNPSNGFGNPFGPTFSDITVWAHETSELANDPFVNTNVAPYVDGTGASFCQGNLETGDVIETMGAQAVYSIGVTTSGGAYTYHPQNTVLLDWFVRNPYSDTATGQQDGTYSWPDTSTLNQHAHTGGGPGINGAWRGEGSGHFCNGVN
jgi:hypothetical protein